MSKRILAVILVIMLMILSACTKGIPYNILTSEQTSAVSSNRNSYMLGDCSKDNVVEFMSVFREQNFEKLSFSYVFDEKYCYNVTSEQIAEETSARIFKFSNSCATFIYLDGQIYPLGEWFGGYGFVNAVPCDFDQDGNTDILYTYSMGSGLHHSLVSVFNTKLKKNTVIYNSSDTNNQQVDLYVSTPSPGRNVTNIGMATHFVIYTVDIEVIEDNFAKLGCVATGVAGSIESENGIPVFRQT